MKIIVFLLSFFLFCSSSKTLFSQGCLACGHYYCCSSCAISAYTVEWKKCLDKYQKPYNQVQMQKCVNEKHEALDALVAKCWQLPALLKYEQSTDQKFDLSVFPNPASDNFTLEISLSGADGVAQVELLNVVGQTIWSDYASLTDGFLRKEIAIKPIVPDGLYLVRVVLNDQLFSGQLILQR